jgi:hypothetical protein
MDTEYIESTLPSPKAGTGLALFSRMWFTQWRTRTPRLDQVGPYLRCASLGRMSPVATRPSCTLRSRVWNLECLACIPLALHTLAPDTCTELRCSVQAPNSVPQTRLSIHHHSAGPPALTPLDSAVYDTRPVAQYTSRTYATTRRLDQSSPARSPGTQHYSAAIGHGRAPQGPRTGVRVRITFLDWSHG